MHFCDVHYFDNSAFINLLALLDCRPLCEEVGLLILL